MYAFYQGSGYYGILMGRICNLLLILFLVNFTLFLAYCVDWSFIHRPATAASHPTLAGVASWAGLWRMSWIVFLLVITCYGIFIWQFVRIFQGLDDLNRMRRFYTCLLGIAEDQIAATDFGEIVDKVAQLHQEHPIGSVARLDAHDISNRIMRKENYLIAIFNKDVFNLNLPLFSLRPSLALTKTMEWNLSFCILNFFFDNQCTVRKGLLKDIRKDKLSQDLQRRLILMGLINLILAPVILLFMVAFFVFRHGEELYRNPRMIGMRHYTTAARWKFREFNELPHYFNQRLANSYRKAAKFMDQSQSSRWTSVARLISFIAGSLTVVLLAITIANEDLLMHFELTSGKSVIWYLGLFGAVLAISRSMVPDWNKASDPAKLMADIAEYTHYMPKHWRGKLYTEQVRAEFAEMFDFKVTMFCHELLGVLFTPFILMFSLPKCSDRLVEFFREFTVEVDGLGYVCSFALFDFKRHGNKKYGAAQTAADKYHQTRQGKMEKSFLSFITNNPTWTPDDTGSQYLTRLKDFEMTQSKRGTVPREGTEAQGSRLFKIPGGLAIRKASPLGRNDKEEDRTEERSFEPGMMSILNQFYDNQTWQR